MNDEKQDVEPTDLDLRRPVIPNQEQLFEASPEQQVNPLKLFMDRLHGRWVWAIVLGCCLSPIFAMIGYAFGPRKFESTSMLVVEAKLDPLVEETLETQKIEVEEAVAEEAQLIKNPEVLYTAFEDDRLLAWVAKNDRSDFQTAIASNLSVQVPRRSALLLVTMSDENPDFAKEAVNAVVRSYMKIFGTKTEIEYEDKFDSVTRRIESTRRRVAQWKQRLNSIRIDQDFGITDVQRVIDDNTTQMEIFDAVVQDHVAQVEAIRNWHAAEAEIVAKREGTEFNPASFEPKANARVEPSVDDLSIIDATLPGDQVIVERLRDRAEDLKTRFGSGSQILKRAISDFVAAEANFNRKYQRAVQDWNRDQGRQFTYLGLQERQQEIAAEREELRSENQKLLEVRIQSEELAAQIEAEQRELQLLENRRQDLDRERESVVGRTDENKRGRVYVRAEGKRPFSPASDKKLMGAVGGAVGGFGLAMAIFFLIGTMDQKTFGVRQLEDNKNSLRVLGVMPNMDDTDDEAETINLATECVHRIRGRIEARRSPERGYAMMVSSPFQGDGKTTLAVSLGWSYAESGYKTLLLDADFIGRAMTHQFGHLKDPGLREIIRQGGVRDEICELGHENLCLLGVGFDRRVSAANLSPRLMGRVLDAVRDQFDIIIIDSGPMTASIEAMPVASAVDGVVLALRRARSRARLAECITDVKSVGADYIGVVLNYADRSDCLRHGSTSRMSASVESALASDDFDGLPEARNPLLGEFGSKND